MTLATCQPEKALPQDEKPPACGTNLHTDDATCKNGVLDPGEMCLEPGGSLPLGKHMHRYEANGPVRVWQGMGDGDFVLVNPGLSLDETRAAVAELNGDAEPDALVVGPSGLRVLFGDVDFTFSAPTTLSSGSTYTELRVADLNEDGANDVVALGPVGVDIFLSHP